MSDLSESESSGLSGWALVSPTGELEGSDADSNTSSIEVVGGDAEVEDEKGHGSSRESSPEFIELEQLMKQADVAAAEVVSCDPCQGLGLDSDGKNGKGSFENEPTQWESMGACCPELLHTTDDSSSTEEKMTDKGRDLASPRRLKSHVSQESDSPATSDSIVSASQDSSSSSISKSSRTDSDSESDFVRLEKEPSCISTESEEEEPHWLSKVNAMTASGSSVGSGFNFLRDTRAPSSPLTAMSCPPFEQQQEGLQELPPPVHQDELLLPPFLPQQPPERPQHEPLGADEEERIMLPDEDAEGAADEGMPQEDGDPVDEEDEVARAQPLHEHLQPEEGLNEVAENQADDDGDDDADTESSTEDGDQDDRIESEQSDDSNSAPPDDLDQLDLSVVNDIGDLPVERGRVERHYIHFNNPQLNGRLNIVVIAVLVLALGMGLGHWIGSTREHFSQLEIQLSQMKRLHQVQDEYMQCVTRNDELLVEADSFLQGERNRHQEAMADLRDNNRELQEQLQDAQDRLEQLMTATARTKSPQGCQYFPALATDSQGTVTVFKLLLASEKQFQTNLTTWDAKLRPHLLMLREMFTKTWDERQAEHQAHLETKLQLAAAKEKQQNIVLQGLREQVNSLELENTDLQINVGKMRYGHKALPEEPLPPPPKPLPPPPLVAIDIRQQVSKDPQLKNYAMEEKKGDAEETESRELTALEQLEMEAASKSGVVSDDHEDATDTSDDMVEDGERDGTDIKENSEEELTESATETGHDCQSHPPVKETLSAKSECSAARPCPVPMDITLLQRNLTEARNRADMWRHLYLSERKETKQINSTTCLQYLKQHVNMSAFVHYMTRWNLTGTEDFTALTYLLSSIAELQHSVLQSLPSMWEELSSKLQDLHDFANHSNDEDTQENEQASGDLEQSPKAEENRGNGGQKGKWSDGMKRLFRKTRGTLSNVSRHIQQTWNRVKVASRHLWHGHDSIFGRMANHLKRSVSKFSHKVHKKASRWFTKQSFEFAKGKHQPHSKVNHGSKEWKQHAKDDKRHPQEEHREMFHGSGDRGHGNRKFSRNDYKEKHGKHKVGEYHQKQSKSRETRFHTQAKDGRSQWNQKAEKIKYKVEKKFHKLFSQVGSMSKKTYNNMDTEGHSEMLEDITKVFKLYQDSNQIGLPPSGEEWLECQLSFWMRAEQGRIRYDPKLVCLRYLAPWQQDFIHELGKRVQKGECQKVRRYSCVDDSTDDDEKENYKYVCIEDADYEQKAEKDKEKYHESQGSAEGKRHSQHDDTKNKQGESKKLAATKEHFSQQVNQTAEDPQDWYFQWVKGRNDLRSVEHKADWMFDRASVRDETREQERSADWMFQRAATRSAKHDDDDDDEEENKQEQKQFEGNDKYRGKYHEKRHRGKHDSSRKKHSAKHYSKEHKGKRFKRKAKDFRQKYGHTSFCESC